MSLMIKETNITYWDTLNTKQNATAAPGSDLKKLYDELGSAVFIYQQTTNYQQSTNAKTTTFFPEQALEALEPQSRLVILNTLKALTDKLQSTHKSVKFYSERCDFSFLSLKPNDNEILIVLFKGNLTNSQTQQRLSCLKQYSSKKYPSKPTIEPVNSEQQQLTSHRIQEHVKKLLAVIDEHDDVNTISGLIASHIAGYFSVDQAVIAFYLDEPNVTKKRFTFQVIGFSNKKEFDDHNPYIKSIEHYLDNYQIIGARQSGEIPNDLIASAVREMALGGLSGCLFSDNNKQQAGEVIQRELNDVIEKISWPLLYKIAKKSSLKKRLSIFLMPSVFARFNRVRTNHWTQLKISIAVLLALALFIPLDYRVNAQATIEGKIQQALASPIDGFLLSSHARAGDVVNKGTLIAKIDSSDLELEHARLNNVKTEHEKTYRKALAEFNQADVRIASAKIEQADAEISLVQQKLSRTSITAPFDGVIVKGDFSQSHGSPINKGDVLFEISPANEYTLILNIKESEIRHINKQQRGALYLNSQPNTAINFQIEKIAAIAQASDRQVYYRVKGTLSEHSEITPGMEGIGKIHVGKKSIGWILLHRPLNWLRFKLWWLLP